MATFDAHADEPVAAIPVTQAGRRAHEAAVERAGIIYMTEDRSITDDLVLGSIGSCFYRYLPKPRGSGQPLAKTTGPLQALKLKDEFHANMDIGRVVGVPYAVDWVAVEEPDHESRIYFDTTSGGAAGLGQVWEYHPGRETLTLIYESSSSADLQNPDNVVVVPQTGHIFLQEDGEGEQYVRGVTRSGEIYDFARTRANETEVCGGCFDPDGHTFYLNQQGERGSLPNGPLNQRAVTYAIYGPF